MAHGGSQYAGTAPTRPLAPSNDSRAHMILHNPGLTHSLTGQTVTDRLDAHGQAEARLARDQAPAGAPPAP